MKRTIYEDSVPVVYSSPTPVLFSELTEKQMGLQLSWKNWSPSLFELRSNGTLIVRKHDGNRTIKGKYDLSNVVVTHMSHRAEDNNNPMIQETGIFLKVKDHESHDTQIRFIMNDTVKESFYEALRSTSVDHNLDSIRQTSITEHVVKSKKKFSAMRTSVAHAMDAYDEISRKKKIVDKRGAFQWLPVLFANDLVHGSWWFVIGSIMFVASSVVVLYNSFDEEIGSDDSFLSRYRYRSTWVLMIICGVFCTLGSMAFVRAVHEDPPMKPLFSWYHFQSDELLGSWLFLFATLPIIPYCLIYLAASHAEPIYILALAVSVVFVFGTYLFVRACYPSDEERKPLIAPIASCLCHCFCSQDWIKKHLCNDWLAGTWFIYWGTLFAFLACGLVLIVELVEVQTLQIFILATAFFENFCFLVGAVYFVAGSYPEAESSEADFSISFKSAKANTKTSSPHLTTPFLGNDDV